MPWKASLLGRDFFPIKLVDAPLENDRASMERPFFSLSKTPDLKVRHYEHNNNSITISPSAKGIATIWDKDVLLYAASALSDQINRGGRVSRTLRLRAHDLLRYTGRGTGKAAYDALQEAFERLAETRIKTDITTGGSRKRSGFGLLVSRLVNRLALTNPAEYGLRRRFPYERLGIAVSIGNISIDGADQLGHAAKATAANAAGGNLRKEPLDPVEPRAARGREVASSALGRRRSTNDRLQLCSMSRRQSQGWRRCS